MASLVFIQDLSNNDVIIDIVKGYALRRIGVYSPNIAHEVIHTFIPIDNLCVESPNTDVCLYASLPIKTNVLEVATIIASSQIIHPPFPHDSDSVSKLISEDMNQVLMQYNPDEIMKEAQSTVHFVDRQFHYKKNAENKLMTPSTNNVIDKYSNIARLYPTTLEVIRNQITSNKIGFDYLSQKDLEFFLTTIFSKFNHPHTIENTEQSSPIFLQTVVGQSIFALRRCSMKSQNSSSRPCLAISTLFLRVPADITTRFLIYRLTPLPIVSNGDKYIYSNLPKIVGINPIDQTLITWNDETDIKQCIFSPIVQCEQIPIPMSLSKSLCLSQLFDDNQSVTDVCKISRSQHIDQDVINIDNGIWLFINIRQTEYCQVTSKELSETLSMSESVIVRMPCDKTITCADVQLPTSSCTQHRTIVKSNIVSKFRNLPSFILPLRNMTETLISSYQQQSQHSIKELSTVFASKRLLTIHDMLLYALGVVLAIIIAILSYIGKYLMYKVRQPIRNFKTVIDDIFTV